MSVSTASACFLANSWFSASCAARCFRVTVACGAAAFGDFAAVLATAAAFFIAMADRLAGCRFSCIVTESRFLPEDKLFLQFHVPAWGTFHRWGVWHGGWVNRFDGDPTKHGKAARCMIFTTGRRPMGRR